ncbi:hypothetical protein [Eudoraea adriatica]|nr:hypothetical protein [Eudoraea adriatica]
MMKLIRLILLTTLSIMAIACQSQRRDSEKEKETIGSDFAK